ncbi:MAG: hypothetical protein JW993_10285 [Sedimentisphaerales bacterium]|nr:hypothetical protein [Sedimentisphaerales bacterium]
MQEWIVQLGLLAQWDDFGDWANILILLIIVVFSMIGGLIKNAEAKKRQQRVGREAAPQRSLAGQPRETWQQRLARKAEEMQRALEAKYQQAQSSPQAPSPAGPRRPEPGKLMIRTDSSGESVLVFERDRPESIAQQQAAGQQQAREAVAAARRAEASRRLAARRQREAEAAAPTLYPHEPSAVATIETPAAQPNAGAPVSLVIDYDDPDALRRAILHYEILGKPLAMRDPFERTADY